MSVAPLLSVIIVAYKSRAEIEACLASIPRTLLGGSVEVVVVDNSPGEGTDGIVHERFPWVKYLAPEVNLGFGWANNLGYAHTNPVGEFVLFLNPDTVCNEAALAHCVKRVEEDPTIGLISPKLVLADGSMDLACRRSIPSLWDGFCRASGLAAIFPHTALFAGYNLTHLPEGGTYDVGAINGAFMFARRSVFDEVAVASPRVEVESLKLKGSATRELKAESSKLKADGSGSAESLKLRAAHQASSVESSELRVERPEAEAESLEHRAQRPELKADSLPLRASRLPLTAKCSSLTASGAQPRHIFDERFFMYGDDLDLCIRVVRAGYRIVYDGAVSITHLKGVSVAKDYQHMSQAIFDANRDVYLKHFNPTNSRWVRWKYAFAFGAWKRIARLRAKLRGHRRVRPL